MAKKLTSKTATKSNAGRAPTKSAATTLQEALKQLGSAGPEAMPAYNKKNGVGDNQFGVKHGDIRVVAKKIKADHELAMSLWKTGNLDARYLAILLIKPK